MLTGTLKTIIAFVATVLFTIFVVALAESISSGFAGFWGGLPFWLIVIFVLGLAFYDFVDECIGIVGGLKTMLQLMGAVFAGAACAFGSWQASKFVNKWDFKVFSLPFSDTEHMISSAWLSGMWVAIAIFCIICAALMVMKILREKEIA